MRSWSRLKKPPLKAAFGLLLLFQSRCLFAAPWEEWDFSFNFSIAPHYSTGSASLDNQENLFGGTLLADATIKGENFTTFAESQVQVPRFGDEPFRDFLLRQAYLDYFGENLDLRIGRQLLIWGRADRFNPTDNITPSDFNFLTIDDQGQRFGAVGATARYFLDEDYSLIFVVLPVFESSKLPQGILPPGISSQENPSVGFDRPEFGLKIERSGERFDASISYYRGYSTSPAVTATASGDLTLINPPIDVIGGDYAVTYGRWGFRGEIAYRRFRHKDQFVPGTAPDSSIYAVVGIERGFGEGNQWLIQWIHRHLESFTSSDQLFFPVNRLGLANDAIFSQFDRVQNGISASLITRWRNDTITAELAGAVFLEHGDFVVRPKFIWSLTDEWRLATVLEWYAGPSDSNFGVLKNNTRLFLEIRGSF